MPIPDTLQGEGVDVLAMDVPRFATERRLSIGEAKMTNLAIDPWDVTRAEGIVHADTGYTFRTAEGSDVWRCGCAVVIEHNVFDEDDSTESRLDEWIECDLVPESGAETWKLTLVTTTRPRFGNAQIVSEGELTDGETRLEVAARHDIAGSGLRPMIPTGFLFAAENDWIAAAETSPAGAFHIRSDVASRERRAIIAAATALLLRRSAGELEWQ